ncbi:MAG: cell wall hydrolase [Lachnospiraceae bacterium]|jgi:uncharacterized protein YgiM (DUF1202 family)|nr:cell wall hydrolase [Lachnospiraceae bacterium]
MLKNKLTAIMLILIVGLSCPLTVKITAQAADDTLVNAGIASLLGSGTFESADVVVEAPEEILNIDQKIEQEQERIGSELAMANVQQALNVRAEADEDSEKVGVLYKDCGGVILERQEGWIKIQSGDVVGWANEEYLLTGEDAQAMADEVGNWVATIETDAVRVRKEPGMDAEVLGYIANIDGIDIIEVMNDDWISVVYENETGYVATDFIDVKYHIDEGETMKVIAAREAEEAERKRQANRGRVDASADETRLLAALIYCEAGNQSYEGMVGVGAVVMNRVRSGAYPNSIHSVIYASGQFTPALSGKVARIYEGSVPDACMQAAAAALAGETTVGGATHFRRAGQREGYILGDHVFW